MKDGDTVRLLTRSSAEQLLFLVRMEGKVSAVEVPRSAKGRDLINAISVARGVSAAGIQTLRHKGTIVKADRKLNSIAVSKQPALIDVELIGSNRTSESNNCTHLGQTVQPEASSNASEGVITISVRTLGCGSTCHLRVKMSTPFRTIFQAVTQWLDVEDHFYLLSDGEKISRDSTPADYGLEDGDQLDLLFSSEGC